MTDQQVTRLQDKPPIVVLRDRLESRKEELKNSLPDDINPDRFIRSVITSAQINPDILACAWQSIWLACMKCCRDGLLPDGAEAAIVPYKSNATYIPMYQGLLRNFRRSGQFKWVTAGIVRQGEEFAHFIDESGEHFKHVPGDDFAAPIMRIYAMATTKDGGIFVTVLPLAEANKIRAMSRATRDDAPWKQWTEEMLKKTALRRLSKMLPSARDYLAGEDDAPEPVDEPLPELLPRRQAGAAAALQQFAGSPELSPKGAPSTEPASAAAASAVLRRAVAADPEGGGGAAADATASESDRQSAATETASDAPAATDPPTSRRDRRTT